MAYGNYAPFYRGGYFNPNPIQNIGENSFQPYAPMRPNTNDIIWVQGESAAKAYPIAPNATVALWDSESPTIYVKSADYGGVPSIRILDFTERQQEMAQNGSCKCGGNCVPKESFDALQAKFEDILSRIETIEANNNK